MARYDKVTPMGLTKDNAIGITLLTVLSLSSSAVIADHWTCEQAGLTREVTIYYPAAPATLPCDVYYTKPSEQALPKRLWSAANEEGYCERKAAEFVETLRALGWQCIREAPKPGAADPQAQGS